MDKRTILAFVLMFAVLMAWSTFFGPKSEPPADEDAVEDVASMSPDGASFQEGAAHQEGTRGAGDAGSTQTGDWEDPASGGDAREAMAEARVSEAGEGSTRAAGWVDLAADVNGPIVTIRTDGFTAELDLVGGDLRSWLLHEYLTVDGDQVQLINAQSLDPNGQTAHALRLVAGSQVFDLKRVRFEIGGRDVRSTGVSDAPYELTLSEESPESEITLTARRADGSTLQLAYSFFNDGTHFDVKARYDHASDSTILSRLGVSWPGGIANTEPDTTREYDEFKAFARVGADVHKKKFNDLRKDGGEKGRALYEGTVDWAGVMAKYFITMLRQEEMRGGLVRFDGNFERRLQTFDVMLPLQGADGPGLNYTVYMGPVDYAKLQALDPEAAGLVDMGPGFIRPLSRLTLWVMIFLHQFIPNYGVIIILLSASTKLMFYPLTKTSTKSMRAMQIIQPDMQRIKEKYKDDQQRQGKEMMALYKTHGVNPMAGCLPLLVQMPFFISLYQVLRKTIELRQEPFILWITDLSRPDVLFELPFTLPVLGSNFCVLPFLMAVSMWAQSKLSTPSGSPKATGQMAQQQKMMTTIMPIMMFVIFYNSPSGLVLYWLVNTILTALQTWRIHSTSPLPVSAEVEPA